MQVSNPRRILAVCLDAQADCLSGLIKDLTGSTPEQEAGSLAGTTHVLSLETRYYAASVPIWLDLIGEPSEWAASFLSDEAREVLAVLGGVILVFALPGPSAPAAVEMLRDLIGQMGRVVGEGLGGWEWDGVRLAVGVGNADTDAGADAEEWDELCAEAGMEFVQLRGSSQPAKNEFGEKTGIARIREALESNDWAQVDDAGDLDDGEGVSGRMGGEDGQLDPDDLGFGFDAADMDGLRRAIWGADGKDGGGTGGTAPSSATGVSSRHSASRDHVEGAGGQEDDAADELEHMMKKLLAVREAGEGLPEAQRRRMAARAVQEVMKDL